MHAADVGRKLLVSVFISLFLLVGVCFTGGTVNAIKTTNRNSATACRTSSRLWRYAGDTIRVYETVSNASCNAGNTMVALFISNCSSELQHVNADLWLTRQVYNGGKRYSETGRSDFITYPPDCGFHFVFNSSINKGGLPDPAYGCAWIQLYTAPQPSYDYLCVYIPHG